MFTGCTKEPCRIVLVNESNVSVKEISVYDQHGEMLGLAVLRPGEKQIHDVDLKGEANVRVFYRGADGKRTPREEEGTYMDCGWAAGSEVEITFKSLESVVLYGKALR